eukprot:GHVU01162707.1.p1 GENE.GHVU01162707.1~~GHVU01162707.1.p1  ORF type:complete len:457 (+),score=48.63 GHVU01162707.1:91-1461(+)
MSGYSRDDLKERADGEPPEAPLEEFRMRIQFINDTSDMIESFSTLMMRVAPSSPKPGTNCLQVWIEMLKVWREKILNPDGTLDEKRALLYLASDVLFRQRARPDWLFKYIFLLFIADVVTRIADIAPEVMQTTWELLTIWKRGRVCDLDTYKKLIQAYTGRWVNSQMRQHIEWLQTQDFVPVAEQLLYVGHDSATSSQAHAPVQAAPSAAKGGAGEVATGTGRDDAIDLSQGEEDASAATTGAAVGSDVAKEQADSLPPSKKGGTGAEPLVAPGATSTTGVHTRDSSETTGAVRRSESDQKVSKEDGLNSAEIMRVHGEFHKLIMEELRIRKRLEDDYGHLVQTAEKLSHKKETRKEKQYELKVATAPTPPGARPGGVAGGMPGSTSEPVRAAENIYNVCVTKECELREEIAVLRRKSLNTLSAYEDSLVDSFAIIVEMRQLLLADIRDLTTGLGT